MEARYPKTGGCEPPILPYVFRMRFLIPCFALLASPALACGPDSDCAVPTGDYRVYLPDGATGAIVFAHGYKGSSAGTLRNANLRALADDLGVALVALNAAGDDWTIPNAPQEGRVPQRDEVTYVSSVKADVVARFDLDPDRMLMAGFSAGGMLTWNVICTGGDLFVAFVPMSGTFWDGPPDACDTDAIVTHYHGTSDGVVPIAGRPIGPTRQGDVTEVVAFYINDRQLAAAAPPPDRSDCQRWSGDQAALEYCTHPGGHRFFIEDIRRVWNRDVN